MSIKYNFVAMDNTVSTRNINRLAKIGEVTKKLAHETAVGILMHKMEHGDHTKMIALLDAIKSSMGGSRAKAFVQWVVTFTNLEYVPEATVGKGKDKVVTPHSFKANKARKDQLEEAQLKPFFEMELPTDLKPVDIQALITSVLQRASSSGIKPGQEGFYAKLVEVTGFEPKRELSEEEKSAARTRKAIETLERKLAEARAKVAGQVKAEA